MTCDAETMPHPTASLDAVTCISVLEHVGLGWYGDPEGDVEKPGRVIAEMARVLKPGGWLLLTVPIWLKMTKDGRPFAREISADALNQWVTDAGNLWAREWMMVSTWLWHEAPDDRRDERVVALVTLQKATRE